jgi:hypothetical protein
MGGGGKIAIWIIGWEVTEDEDEEGLAGTE